LKIDPLTVVLCLEYGVTCLVFGAAAGGDSAKVAVTKSVGITFERDNFGVVDQSVDHCRGHHVVAEDFAPIARMVCCW
jgi:hypothetical protein